MFFDDDHAPAVYSFADDAPIEWVDESQPEEETASSGPLSLSTRLEYTSLKVNEAYNVFGLVSVQAAESVSATAASPAQPADSSTRSTPMDITCVLDVSGSMGSNSKIELLKDAVQFVIGEMMPTDRLSIVTFNHGAERKTPLMCMDNAGKDAARQATLRLAASGGTDIASGLDCGVAVMEQRRQRNAIGAIFLLTDGQCYVPPGTVQQLCDRARAAHCGLYTFGFGEDHDTKTLSSIAECARTPFTYVESPESIKHAFAGAVGGLTSVAAQNIELRIVPDGGCTIAALHTHFTHRSEGGAAVVSIPDAFAGERRDIVVELAVPATSADSPDNGLPLIHAAARYTAVQERVTVQTPEVALFAQRTEEPEGEPDLEVAVQRQRIEVANALEQAISQGEAGRFEAAQSMLDHNIDKIEKSKAKNEVSTALLAELNDARCRLSSRSEWQKGGHAELADAMMMHKNQRCTNMSVSKSNKVAKCSKQLYLRSAQRSSIAKCDI